MKKLFGKSLASLFVFFSVFAVASVVGASGPSSLDLSDIDLSELKPGDVIEHEDYKIRQLTPEEEVEELGFSLASTKEFSTNDECAQGATAFSRRLEVTDSYRPLLDIFTELCLDSNGNYVIESIVAVGIMAEHNGVTKGWNGTVDAEALNNGNTLFYLAQGDFHNNSSTTVGATTGANTPVFQATMNASTTSSFYANLYQSDNIILHSN